MFYKYFSFQIMFNTAMHAECIHDHADYGFTTSEVKFDWE